MPLTNFICFRFSLLNCKISFFSLYCLPPLSKTAVYWTQSLIVQKSHFLSSFVFDDTWLKPKMLPVFRQEFFFHCPSAYSNRRLTSLRSKTEQQASQTYFSTPLLAFAELGNTAFLVAPTMWYPLIFCSSHPLKRNALSIRPLLVTSRLIGTQNRYSSNST